MQNIIQSYTKANNSKIFYVSLLSYITLKKYYGAVTMYCDDISNDVFIKYIPYDEVVYLDTDNITKYEHSNPFWFYAKIMALKKNGIDSIHVDNDIIIFDNILDEYVFGDYDLITQQYEYGNLWIPYGIVFNDHVILKKMQQYAYNDNFSVNCGFFGFKNIDIRDEYFDTIDEYIKIFNDNDWVNTNKYSQDLIKLYPLVIEQSNLYNHVKKNNLSTYTVLNNTVDYYDNYKQAITSKKMTHLWSYYKYENNIIELIKRKIKKSHPEYYKYVICFEKYNL